MRQVQGCFYAGLLLAGTSLVPAQEKITVAGSSTIRPIVEEAAKAWKKINPKVKFVIGGGGSSHGVKCTGTGKALLGMASRDLKAKENKQYPDIVAHTIGLDGIAVIVHKKNPLLKITRKQVQEIYTGKIKNWKELGGEDKPIYLISKEEGRSTLGLFLKYFGLEAHEVKAGKRHVMAHRVKTKDGKSTWSEVTATLIGPNRQALGAVSTKTNAIAYVSVGTAQEVAAKGGRVKLLDLDGVQATVANVAAKTYPLRRPLNLVTKGEPQGELKAFVDFLVSGEGQKIVARLEFIPLKPAAEPAK